MFQMFVNLGEQFQYMSNSLKLTHIKATETSLNDWLMWHFDFHPSRYEIVLYVYFMDRTI